MRDPCCHPDDICVEYTLAHLLNQLSALPPAAPVNVWPVVVKRAIFLGDLTQVHVDWGGRELIIRQTGAATPAEGSTAYLSIDSGHCVLLEPE